MSDISNLIAELERADGPSRKLDLGIAYAVGLGTALEREIFGEHGADAFIIQDRDGLTAWSRAKGDHVRHRRIGRSSRFEPEIVRTVYGPMPLAHCEGYTRDVDAARSLIPPGHSFALGDCGEENAPWACVTAPDPDNRDFDCRSAVSEAIALTIAALKARSA